MYLLQQPWYIGPVVAHDKPLVVGEVLHNLSMNRKSRFMEVCKHTILVSLSLYASHVCILGKEDVLPDDPLECGADGGGVGLADGVEVGDELGAVPGRLPDGAGQLPLHHLLLITGGKLSRQQKNKDMRRNALLLEQMVTAGKLMFHTA